MAFFPRNFGTPDEFSFTIFEVIDFFHFAKIRSISQMNRGKMFFAARLLIPSPR